MTEFADKEFSFCSPLRSTIFISHDKKVAKACGVHISREGILVSSTERINQVPELDFMFLLQEYPDFSKLSEDEIFQMELKRSIYLNNFPKHTLRCVGDLYRQNRAATNNFYSLRFIRPERDLEKLLFEYLDQFTHNLIYLVDLIGNIKKRKLLYPIAFFLGYETSNEGELCKEILHDFHKLKKY